MNDTRKKIIAGNWKMNLSLQEAQSLIAELIGMVQDEKQNDSHVYIFPPFVYINTINKQIQDNPIYVGAQNCADQMSGAYTGEVSVSMLNSIGAKAVLIGHSERRTYYHESNESCANKINLAIQHGLTPFYCIGETITERNSNQQYDIIEKQLNEGIFHLNETDFSKCVIAYEPVWAIGTGLTASPEQAQEMHAFIRSKISDKYSMNIAQNISILYGGSCNDQNAKELFVLPDVDGGLIGGASLKSRTFMNIIKAF
jgi:triosephosphate isomerase